MAKVKAKLKNGETIEVYENERYSLWKKDLVTVTKKTEEKYKEQQANEKPKIVNKAIAGTQFDGLEKRVTKLEKRDGNYDDKDLKESLAALKNANETLLQELSALEARIIVLEPKKEE